MERWSDTIWFEGVMLLLFVALSALTWVLVLGAWTPGR